MQMVVAAEAASEPIGLTNPAVLAAIMAQFAARYPNETITINTDIFTGGLADSQTFLDILFVVEEATGTRFDQELFGDFEHMTPARMAQAFKVP